MKISTHKIVFLSILAFFFFTSSKELSAQKIELGARFMPTFTAFNIYTPSGGTAYGSFTAGWGFGGFVGYQFNKHIGLQGEVIYNSLSQKYKENDVVRNINLRYINIPILLSLNTNKYKTVNFNAVVGPQLGISVGSTIGSDVSTTKAVLVTKTGDLGIAYGAGLDVGINESKTFRLGFGFRGVYGLLDISDHSTTLVTDNYYILDRSQIKTYSVYLGISYLFGKAKAE